MTKLVVLFIIASRCVFAQEAIAPASEERWAYCVAESRIANWIDRRYEGTVKVCYSTDQGCKEESITAPDELKGQTYDEGEAAVVEQRAVAKAMAQLGKDRWELVPRPLERHVVSSAAREGQPERGHLLAVANQQHVAD